MYSSLAPSRRFDPFTVSCLAIFSLSLLFPHGALAATYFVDPAGAGGLSTAPASPGSLAWAAANAPAGSTVVLEDGVYDGAPNGFTVSVSGVTFESKTWHGAQIENSTGDNLMGASTDAANDVCLGIVFGPCVKPGAQGWSGGGGDGWRFQDCEFKQNDGMGFGKGSLVLHCLFTDAWFNSFDVASNDFTMRNTIVRRGNRANGDSDSIGNKEDVAFNLLFDGLIDYDNQGAGLWFDTNNKNWVVKNSTFFANHGGANWYTLGVVSSGTTSQFTGNGQDGAGVDKGARIMEVQGAAANLGRQEIVTAVDGYNPMTITVSPALPEAPKPGDQFAVQQGGSASSGGTGLVSEANPNGSFIDNVTYDNTDSGFSDNDSGDGFGVAGAGMVITGNRFFYDGIAFRGIDGGSGDPTRKLGPAIVERNTFKVGASSARYAFKVVSNGSFGFPASFYGIKFDHNTYSPDAGYAGPWATWYIWTNYPKPGWYSTDYKASSLAELRSPSTFDQDQHSDVANISLRGPSPAAYDWPPSDSTNWTDIYCPNNVYGASNSIHQVDDDETPYIQTALAGKSSGQRVKLTVFGHTAFTGNGPYACDVYDYSGRFVTLTLKSRADEAALDAAVPDYAVLAPSTITVRLTSSPSDAPYALTAVFTAPRSVR